MAPSETTIEDVVSAATRLKHNISSTSNNNLGRDNRHDANNTDPGVSSIKKFSLSPSPPSSSRRIIFPNIHNNGMIRQQQPGHNHYQLASTPRCLEKYSNNNKTTVAVPTSQISILRRKTSSQSSLSIISEDDNNRFSPVQEIDSSLINNNKDINNKNNLSSITPALTHASSTSIPSLLPSVNSWCSDDCILSLTSQVEDTDFRRSHSGTCMCSCMRKGKSNNIYRQNKCATNKVISKNNNIGISFDPRVWVYEYQQDNVEVNGENWYNTTEIEQFKQNAIACIKEQEILNNNNNLSDTNYVNKLPLKVFFNHPALVSGCSAQTEVMDSSSIPSTFPSPSNKRLDVNLNVHIKNILLIDSDDLFLKIFKRAFEYMFPHSNVATCKNGVDALQCIKDAKISGCSRKRSTYGFDIILFDEKQLLLTENNNNVSGNKKQSSPSFDFQKLIVEREEAKQESTFYFQGEKILHHTRYTLFIGVVNGDAEGENSSSKQLLMNNSDVDIIWTKNPPPTVDKNLRNELLYKIMEHRNC